MSRTWTGGRAALPRGHPFPSRVPLLVIAVCAVLLLPACRGDEGKRNQILPIRASLAFADPEPLGPAIFLKQSALDRDADDELVILDIVLRTPGGVEFDAFDIEIGFDPGIVQLGGDPMDPLFSSTPFGTCNQCVRTCGSGPDCQLCDQPCDPCSQCRQDKQAACSAGTGNCPGCDNFCQPLVSNVVTSPLCLFNSSDANATGILTVGVAINQQSDCAPSLTTSNDETLLTIGLVAASTGKSDIDLVTSPDPNRPLKCAILKDLGDLGIPCYDRNATLTGAR